MGYFSKGNWTDDEDRMLELIVSTLGSQSWLHISDSMGTRTAKQCRERYHNFLKPDLVHTPITIEEAKTIVVMVAQHGRRWAMISKCLEGRSDNAVKNWWYSYAHRQRRVAKGNVRLESERQMLVGTTQSIQMQPTRNETTSTSHSRKQRAPFQNSATEPITEDSASHQHHHNWHSNHTRVETREPDSIRTSNKEHATFSNPVLDPSTRTLPSIAGLQVHDLNQSNVEIKTPLQQTQRPTFQ